MKVRSVSSSSKSRPTKTLYTLPKKAMMVLATTKITSNYLLVMSQQGGPFLELVKSDITQICVVENMVRVLKDRVSSAYSST